MGSAAQMHHHAGTGELLNVTFMRVYPEATLKVNVPLKYIGEDACVGIRKGGIWDTTFLGVIIVIIFLLLLSRLCVVFSMTLIISCVVITNYIIANTFIMIMLLLLRYC